MRRILIFSLAYYPQFVGGAEVAVKEITKRISESDIRFDLITLQSGNSSFEKIENVDVYRVRPSFLGRGSEKKLSALAKLFYIHSAYKKALKLHSENNYDGVWSIMASYAGYAGYLFKKKNPGIPFLLTIQEGDNFSKRHGLLRSFFERVFKSADYIQAISNFLGEWSASMGANCPIEVIPNGVDVDRFSAPILAEKRLGIRKECGFGENDFVAVTASRLVEKNAVDDLISSLKDLDRNCKLLILGSGNQEGELKALAAKLGVDKRVFFKGYVEHDKLPDYLKSSDVFVRASRSEGLGNSFLEAMAAGIPVIATPVGGIPDFLIDGENGFFCEVNNPKSIAQKISKVMKDKESKEYIVKRARETVSVSYDWKNIALKMKNWLQNAIS